MFDLMMIDLSTEQEVMEDSAWKSPFFLCRNDFDVLNLARYLRFSISFYPFVSPARRNS